MSTTLLENFCPKYKKTFVLSPKLLKVHFFSTAFFSAIFVWTRNVHFWQSCRKTFPKGPQNFNLVSKYELVYLSKGSFFHDNFTRARREQFWQSSQNSCNKSPEKVRPLSWKKNKPCFSKKLVFHGLFLWTQMMQFWQPCLDNFAVNLKIFPLKCETQSEIVFFSKKTLPVKTVIWKRRVQSSQPCQESFT